MHCPCYFPDELRRTLGKERGDALAIVGAVAELPLQVTLEVELAFERGLRRRVERAT